MTDQTRTGTYGSWYSYYICGFSGEIDLPPELQGLPGLGQTQAELSQLDFRTTAPRCNMMRRYTDMQILRLGAITLVVMLLLMAATFNLSKFPGFGGTHVHRRVRRRQRHPPRQHGAGRRHPGRPRPGGLARAATP